MPIGGGIFGLAILALWAYCIFDVISTDEARIQNLPKMIWLLIVILVPPIGPIAWLLLGRPAGADWRLGSSDARPRLQAPPPPTLGLPERPISPDDHAAKREEALRRYNEEREEELRLREEELRRREEEFRRRELGETDS